MFFFVLCHSLIVSCFILKYHTFRLKYFASYPHYPSVTYLVCVFPCLSATSSLYPVSSVPAFSLVLVLLVFFDLCLVFLNLAYSLFRQLVLDLYWPACTIVTLCEQYDADETLNVIFKSKMSKQKLSERE